MYILPIHLDLTGRSTDEIGLLSSIPNATTLFLYPLAGTLKDYWKNHTDIELTRVSYDDERFIFTHIYCSEKRICIIFHSMQTDG